MKYLLSITLLAFWFTDSLTLVNDSLYQLINSLAGRNWVFDSLIGLPLESNLVKAALIGACFLFVWHQGTDTIEIVRRRQILLITLLATVFVMATTKTLSKTVFLPRPFIQSQKTFHLENNQLVESPRLSYRVPLDEENQKSYKALQRGEIVQNDLGSFPSDHAGLYMTLAVGIFLASRSIGLIAVFWALFVTLGSRVVTGQHSPLDIAVGSGIGIGILLIFQVVAENWGKRLIEPIVGWTLKHSAFASSLIFVFVFEATNTFENARYLLKSGKEIVKHIIGG